MTNQERAAAIAYEAMLEAPRRRGMENDVPNYIAKRLADAGLLMPDLPAPSEEIIWHEDSFEVWASERHGTVEISGTGQPQIHVPIDRAEHLALCIIAAAKLAEEQE